MDTYICPICGNSDQRSIGYRKGKPYCRKCLTFRGEEAKEYKSFPKKISFSLAYELSDEQKELSAQLVENYKAGINSLVYAVCGSGKTEIVLGAINYALQCGEKVGFAIPRRDVVIELSERIGGIFNKNTVTCVYGGHTDNLYADIVMLTSHQLYRYNNYFDLLIMDEIDAFPFNGNEVLESFFEKSCRKNYILMSATPSEQIKKKFTQDGFAVLELFTRFHNSPLPVPEIVCKPKGILLIKLIEYLKEFLGNKKSVFVFAPTIEICEEIFNFLSLVIKGGNYVHSKRENRGKIISEFRDGKYRYLVTTAVLERGVTVKGLQVIIYLANHNVYSKGTLIQISGRAGRKKEDPKGRVIYLANEKTKEMQESITEIERANKNLQSLF